MAAVNKLQFSQSHLGASALDSPPTGFKRFESLARRGVAADVENPADAAQAYWRSQTAQAAKAN
jgi:hypothetical protein